MPRPSHLVPVLVAAAGIATFSVMDALMKRASILAGAYEAMLCRSLLGGVVMLPLWRLRGGRWPNAQAMRIHAARGLVAVAMATTFFWGLVRTPMAEGIALSFVAPLIALFLAAVTLGERIAPRAWLASLLGLVGVAVIAFTRMNENGPSRPDALQGIAAILVSAVFYAGNLVLQRRQAQLSDPAEVACFQFLFGALFLAPLWFWLGGPLPVAAFGDIAVAAVLATISLMALSWAYGRAQTQVLLPLEYTAFFWAALMGYWWFGEPLGWPTLAGTALIVLACWYGTTGSPGHADHVEQIAL